MCAYQHLQHSSWLFCKFHNRTLRACYQSVSDCHFRWYCSHCYYCVGLRRWYCLPSASWHCSMETKKMTRRMCTWTCRGAHGSVRTCMRVSVCAGMRVCVYVCACERVHGVRIPSVFRCVKLLLFGRQSVCFCLCSLFSLSTVLIISHLGLWVAGSEPGSKSPLQNE